MMSEATKYGTPEKLAVGVIGVEIAGEPRVVRFPIASVDLRTAEFRPMEAGLSAGDVGGRGVRIDHGDVAVGGGEVSEGGVVGVEARRTGNGDGAPKGSN